MNSTLTTGNKRSTGWARKAAAKAEEKRVTTVARKATSQESASRRAKVRVRARTSRKVEALVKGKLNKDLTDKLDKVGLKAAVEKAWAEKVSMAIA
jgi:hypothetical protein